MNSPTRSFTASGRPPEYFVKNYVFRALGPSEVCKAQRLLYDCYIREGEWKISSVSPSNIKILEATSEWELTDDFSSTAAWFGAFDGYELIGCFRVLKTLELPGYIDIPEELKTQSIELNRLAIASKYRNHRVVTLMLLRTTFDYAFSESPVVYVTAKYPEPSGMFQRMGLVRYGFEPFKYHEADPGKVDILYYDTRKYDRYSTSLYRITTNLLSQ